MLKLYTLEGLTIWFQTMIPALFPFLVLTNLLIKSNLAETLAKPFAMILGPIYQLSDTAIFVLIAGFLFGFPIGAKCTVMLYQQGKLTKSEAEYLLSFTNQFSPAYLISFVLDMIFIPNGITLSIIQLFALFYGIPLLYGLIIRYTHYYKSINKRIVIASHRKMKYNDSNHSHQNVLSKSKSKNRISSLQYIPDSISDSICQIGMLGGYMIACSSLRIIPALLLKKVRFLSLFIESSLEISSGLNNLAAHINEPRRLLLTASANLSFGGICCLFQTLSLLSETDLSSQKYMLHKAILCSITVIAIWILYF